MTLEEIRKKIRDALAKRATLETELDGFAERGDDLTDTETQRFAELRTELRTLDDEIDELSTREAELGDDEARRARADELRSRLGQGDTGQTRGGGAPGGIRVGDEPHTYREGGRRSFLVDLFRAQIGNDLSARDALNRHMDELRADGDSRVEVFDSELRDGTTTSFGGFVPPRYLVDQFADLVRSGRPFLNALTSRPLDPDGVSFTIPRVTTGSTAGAKAENAAWSEQDIAETDLTFRAELITAQQDISRALFQRGGMVVDQVVFPDMVAAYHTELDRIGIEGSGTSPEHRGVLSVSGITSVTYTDASPTQAEAWPKIVEAIGKVGNARKAGATLVVMTPLRWAWFLSAKDSEGRPLFPDAGNAPTNAVGMQTAVGYGQVVGNVAGVPVVTDGNVPEDLGAGTNEDRIMVLRSPDVLLFEENGGDPIAFTFEQTGGPQTVRLAVGGFTGFTAGRYPTGIAVVSGTGLVTPTF